ncbi:hypothetical protein DK28_0201785 [Peptococcaceae bacterium SCADC1_2_3]|nr:hypothetical protein DK28_0201785 [Peptococcaceae bacterium SCADC1_2_3]KFI34660.1 hypothetical protein HY00_10780 [Peptococcaceae bacterium SCADC1_2_3]
MPVKTAQPAGIHSLLSLNNNYAYNLPAKFLIAQKNEVAISKGLLLWGFWEARGRSLCFPYSLNNVA